MVFGALPVADDPAQVPEQPRGKLFGDVLGPAHPLSGIESGLDLRGEPHLLLSVEQRDLTDLLEIDPHRVDRDGEFSVLAGLAQRLGLLLVPNTIPGLLDVVQWLCRTHSALNSQRNVVIRQVEEH